MKIIEYNTENGKKALQKVLARTQLDYKDAPKIVAEIIENVKQNGDKALFEYTKTFDKADLNATNIKITKSEIEAAYKQTDPKLLDVMRNSAQRIKKFHEKQKRAGWFDTTENDGEILGQMILPLETVGVYVPGGKAAYPSSVLMNVVPAVVAGVKNIIMCTPPNANGFIVPTILAAADIAGASAIYKAGGAQAIAAMAFGTRSIPKVDKITGPGNIYVALAKRAVFGYVSIDSIAGPSEILIIADETANAKFVTADLMSQAEHDELAAAILITTSKKLAEDVIALIETAIKNCKRKQIAETSIKDNGAIVLVKTLEEAFEISNQIAPEHLEICADNAFSHLPKVKNAGAVFLGNYTPEPLGDYMAGPNHVLPTGGTAKFFSPLNVDDFTKKTSVLHFDKNAFNKLAGDCITFAEAEGLFEHGNSVRARG